MNSLNDTIKNAIFYYLDKYHENTSMQSCILNLYLVHRKLRPSYFMQNKLEDDVLFDILNLVNIMKIFYKIHKYSILFCNEYISYDFYSLTPLESGGVLGYSMKLPPVQEIRISISMDFTSYISNKSSNIYVEVGDPKNENIDNIIDIYSKKITDWNNYISADLPELNIIFTCKLNIVIFYEKSIYVIKKISIN